MADQAPGFRARAADLGKSLGGKTGGTIGRAIIRGALGGMLRLSLSPQSDPAGMPRASARYPVIRQRRRHIPGGWRRNAP